MQEAFTRVCTFERSERLDSGAETPDSTLWKRHMGAES